MTVNCKKQVKGVGVFPALQALGFKDNGRMRLRDGGDVCVLGAYTGKGFWVMNLTRNSKSCFTPAELAKHFTPLAQEEAIA